MENAPKYVYLKSIPGNKTAITIYPYIFWSKSKMGWVNNAIVKHEMYHWYDQKRWIENKKFGLAKWLLKYLFLWFWINFIKRLPAEKHPMEMPAYQTQYQK